MRIGLHAHARFKQFIEIDSVFYFGCFSQRSHTGLMWYGVLDPLTTAPIQVSGLTPFRVGDGDPSLITDR